MTTDLSTWETASFDNTVDHILACYHEVHRKQFNELIPLAEKVSRVHEGKFSAEVLPLLQQMENDLLSHMMKEERVLFPMIKQGVGRGAAMPIKMMMHEHNDHEDVISRLLALTDNLTAPSDACGSWRMLYALAREMVNDLQDHIRLENDILFARVLAS